MRDIKRREAFRKVMPPEAFCMFSKGFLTERGKVYCSGEIVPVAYRERPKKEVGKLCRTHYEIAREAFEEIKQMHTPFSPYQGRFDLPRKCLSCWSLLGRLEEGKYYCTNSKCKREWWRNDLGLLEPSEERK